MRVPGQRAETAGHRLWRVTAVIAVGGAAGATARHGAERLLPTPDGAFPWTTFLVNVVGCGLIGVLMVLVAEGGRPAHPLLRPFLGVGVLGGFTTFSAYTLDFLRLVRHGEAPAALGYAAVTLVGALVAVGLTATLTRRAVAREAAL
ncbi:CrcB family protein [Streptomyces sp. NBC_01498]|uniref:fluoride efflux transporter FluC n=1 Tax=Streptomyces sp. NBC_01498 TaxID=2975870 RepID=UPI002E7B8E2D|nr:CrcB family protein [Streptomyces sp. NBC_01498]WTL28851.1 CrcB family protein [Streptomyces sp. NBC_01498]